MKLNIKENIYKLPVSFWIFNIIILSATYIYYLKVLSPQLLFHLQQPGFVKTFSYVKGYLVYPGGISEYISNFLAQSFYFNWLGAFCLLFLGILSIYLCYKIFKEFNSSVLFLSISYLPFIFFTALLNDYYFPVQIFIQNLIGYIFIISYLNFTKNGRNHIPFYLIFALIIYYLAGGEILLLFSIAVLLFSFTLRIPRKKFFCYFTILLIIVIIPFVSYKIIFNISLKEAYFNLIPDRPIILKYNGNVLLYLFYLLLPVAISCLIFFPLLFKSLSNRLKPNANRIFQYFVKIRSTGITYINFMIVLFLLLICFNSFDKHDKNKVLVDFYNYNEKWKEAADVAISDKEYDIYLNFEYNRAIRNSNKFLDYFFEYPQLMGEDGLFPDKINAPSITMISCDFYYDLGYMGQAYHWTYEAQTSMPYSPKILKKLVLINLINKNYTAADNLLKLLDKMFFNKDFVSKYKSYLLDTSLISKDPLIMEKRGFMPKNIIDPFTITARFQELTNKNNLNRMAYEHLIMYYLLENKLGNAMSLLNGLKQFYDKLPDVIEQAVLIYLIKSNQSGLIEKMINNKVKNDFKDYHDILYKYGGNTHAAKKELKLKYENTYFYYIMFNSPAVTKAELKIKKY